jgi:hypothetical protein
MDDGHQFACASVVALFCVCLLITTNSFVKARTPKAVQLSPDVCHFALACSLFQVHPATGTSSSIGRSQ